MFISRNIVLFLITIHFFSQEVVTVKPNLTPTSIFTSLKLDTDINNYYNINKKLNLRSYSFVFIDVKNIEEGYFTIPFNNFKHPPSNYIFETYQDIYHTMNLKQSFFKVSNLYKVPSRLE